MEKDIRQAILTALGHLGMEPVQFVVEHPTELQHGDYATNVALVAAKAVGENPRELAAKIAAKIPNRELGVGSVSVEGPGFINFKLGRDFFREKIATARVAGEHWGWNEAEKDEVVMIEYTSPNLFKPLHVGNLVGNIIGESLSRLFEASGATVVRCNYPSDIGLTVAKGVWGLIHTAGDPSDISALGEAYRVGNEAYEAGGQSKEEIVAINKALYEGSDEQLNQLRAAGIATSKQRLEELCRLLGTQFDVEIFESQAGKPGQEMVRAHTGDVFSHSDGAVVYEGEKVGLHTRVFLTSQGLPTYEAKDVGNFYLKQEATPSWTKSLVVTGNEQLEYFKVLFAALRELFPEANERYLEHIPTGFLTLTTGKMSSRKGNVLTGESLLEEMRVAARSRAEATRAQNVDVLTEEIAVAALKYQILRQNVGANIVFDKEKALSFEGDSGPYLQYTHARISSVLQKVAESGITPSTDHQPGDPYEIERVLYRFPEVVNKALTERAPHTLVGFLTEVAGSFNTFYAREQIADPQDEYASYKAALTEAVRHTLNNGLWMLGIQAPERM